MRGLIVTFATQSSLDPRALIARKVNTLGAISRGLFARSLLRIPCACGVTRVAILAGASGRPRGGARLIALVG